MGRKISVDIALPVYYGNIPELSRSVKTLVAYCRRYLREYRWTIVLAVNGKQPATILPVARSLKKRYRGVTYIYTPEPGKGNGVLAAWQRRLADIYTYMDVDLSTDLGAFRSLLDGIKEGHDIVVGSRYHQDSRIKRSLKRYIISRGYIVLFYRSILGVPVHDAQCGLKAINARVVREILPLIRDRVWFWESEMLYVAHRKGFSIKEIPVVWTENKVSGVNLLKIIPNFIRNVLRLRFTRTS